MAPRPLCDLCRHRAPPGADGACAGDGADPPAGRGDAGGAVHRPAHSMAGARLDGRRRAGCAGGSVPRPALRGPLAPRARGLLGRRPLQPAAVRRGQRGSDRRLRPPAVVRGTGRVPAPRPFGRARRRGGVTEAVPGADAHRRAAAMAPIRHRSGAQRPPRHACRLHPARAGRDVAVRDGRPVAVAEGAQPRLRADLGVDPVCALDRRRPVPDHRLERRHHDPSVAAAPRGRRLHPHGCHPCRDGRRRDRRRAEEQLESRLRNGAGPRARGAPAGRAESVPIRGSASAGVDGPGGSDPQIEVSVRRAHRVGPGAVRAAAVPAPVPQRLDDRSAHPVCGLRARGPRLPHRSD